MTPRVRRAGQLALLCTVSLALLLGGDAAPPVRAADDTAPDDVYVRRRFDIPGTVAWLADEARRIDAGQVLVVFDAVTFAPPPGLTEFTSEYAFCLDLEAWTKALGAWPEGSGAVLRATSSLAPRTVLVGGADWKADLLGIVTRPWYESDQVQQLEPADRWMTRSAARCLPKPSAAFVRHESASRETSASG